MPSGAKGASGVPVAADGIEVALLKREVGRRLRLARESIGFPVAAQFAREHGIASDKLNHWEKGKHFPDVLMFVAPLSDNC